MRTLLFSALIANLLYVLAPLAAVGRDDSLVLYFPFDEGGGKVVKDLTQYKNNGGFLEGDPVWDNGKVGKALAFNAKFYVEVPDDNDTLDLTETGHTISYWLKWDGGLTSWSPFVSKADDENTNDNYHTWVGKDGVWDYYASGSPQAHGKNRVPLDNQWIFLTVTHDGKKTVSFFMNGVFTNEGTVALFKTNDAGFRVGHDGFSPVIGAGTMDELTVFNRPLSEAEVQTLMKEGAAPFLAVAPADKLTTTWGNVKINRLM